MRAVIMTMAGVACLCAASCGRSLAPSVEIEAPVDTTAPTNTFVHVANVIGIEEAAGFARADLAARGIPCVISNSGATYSVKVAPANRAKAVKALQAGSEDRCYPVSFE